jgi:phenylacetate-CoA ligase
MPPLLHAASYADYIPREPLRQLQSRRLRQMVAQAYECVPLYRQRMRKLDLSPHDIGGVEDLSRLPFTTSKDLAEAYPTGMLAVPFSHVARLHIPCGTLGSAAVVAYTRRDLEVLASVMARSLAMCGLHEDDVILNVCSHNLLVHAVAIDQAAAALGAILIPAPAGDVARLLTMIKDFGATAVCAAAGFLVHLIEQAGRHGRELRGLPLRVAVALAEPLPEPLCHRIEQASGIRVHEVFGVPELMGPGLGAECAEQDGFHLFEDHFFPEIIDPASGALLPDGHEGELVITTLDRQAMPVIRYRTGGRTALLAEPCPCGRTLRRIRRLVLPEAEVFIVHGAAIAPARIVEVLQTVTGELPPYQLVLAQQDGVDQLEVELEVTPRIFQDQVAALESVRTRLEQGLEAALGVRVPVRFLEPHAIRREGGTSGRLIDRRG